jgi:hypothetical protein
VKSKRIIASALGVAALLAALIAILPAIDLMIELRVPAVSFWFATMGVLLMLSIALAEFGIAIWFFRFARREHDLDASWIRPILAGVGCFFPGLVFSLPLTVFWARYTWPGNGQAVLGAIPFSLEIGIAAAVFACAVFLKKRRTAWSLGK